MGFFIRNSPAPLRGKREIENVEDLKLDKRSKVEVGYLESSSSHKDLKPSRSDPSKINWKKLEEQAEKKTWEMYERAKKEETSSDDLLATVEYAEQERIADPNYRISSEEGLMRYFYPRKSSSHHPYDALRVNRDEYGECIFSEDSDERELYMTGGLWGGLEKDQQYCRLAKEVRKLGRLEWGQGLVRQHTSAAVELARQHNLTLLQLSDIKACVFEVIRYSVDIGPLDAIRSFGYTLLREEITPDRYYTRLEEARRAFPSVEYNALSLVMKKVFPSGKKESEEVAKKWIDDYYRQQKRFRQRENFYFASQYPTPRLRYIEFKLGIALEINIIKETKEGFFVHVSPEPEE